MQAVVIAGGLGTRLRPLTFNRPKALVPLLNKPQILHLLERLPKSVDEVFVAVNYMYDRVREFFQEADAGRSGEVSMEREVFPALASKGLHGFPFDGYWGDAGTLEGYLAATGMLLADGGAGVDPRAKVDGARLEGAVLIPEGCEVSGRLGPDV